MWSAPQSLVNYGEAVGTMIVAGVLIDWALNERQRTWLADRSARLWNGAAGVRRRWLLDIFGRAQFQRVFLALVFLGEAVLVWDLARRMGYRGMTATLRDVLVADLLLFIMPLCVAAAALIAAGRRLMALLVGSGNLPACLGKCAAAALAANLIAYGALRAMDATFVAFGPRALLDWWDVRLWIYAAEYALSGVIVSAIMIANLLVAILGAAGLGILVLALTLLQAELLARLIARYPKGSLLGSSIAVAGLAIVIKDWM
jgi:hypothetical protein